MKTPTIESYSEIQYAYDYFNRELFDGKLPSCLITYQRQKRIMGYVSFRRWVNECKEYVDELAINPEYFANYPTIEICQTLCHEMVHIWQAHYGQPGRRGYHNKEWAKQMSRIGLIPSDTGKPGGNETGEQVSDYILTNGRFMKACQLLLSSGFQIHWIDRFPVYREESPVIVYERSGEPIKLTANLASKLSDSAVSSFKKDELLAQWEDSSDDNEAELFESNESQGKGLASTKHVNRSNRHKYQCRSCGIRVWGKPDLNVVCGDCGRRLVVDIN